MKVRNYAKSDPAAFECEGYAPTIIIHGREQGSGDTVTRVSAPGSQSITRINSSGQISLVIHGADGIGRSGETRVAEHLQSFLSARGVRAELLPGTDDRGEDRRIRTSDLTLNVQIVTVPPSKEIWQNARRSSASTTVQLEGAVEWIRQSIQKKVDKTTRDDRGRTILVLDAQHANPLTEPAVIDRYISTNDDPHERFGFAGVLIVGSTSTHCARIGKSVV